MSYRAHTFTIASKSNYKTNWTAKYKVNLKKRIEQPYYLACYYSIPTDNTSNNLLPAQINARLCTHLIVAFAQVQNNSVYFRSSFDIEVRSFILLFLNIVYIIYNNIRYIIFIYSKQLF